MSKKLLFVLVLFALIGFVLSFPGIAWGNEYGQTGAASLDFTFSPATVTSACTAGTSLNNVSMVVMNRSARYKLTDIKVGRIKLLSATVSNVAAPQITWNWKRINAIQKNSQITKNSALTITFRQAGTGDYTFMLTLSGRINNQKVNVTKTLVVDCP